MYSKKVEGDNIAKACSHNLRISVKNAKPVCKSVRGMRLSVAKQFLNNVINAKRNIGGRYYPKTTKEVLNIILSAEKNAEFKNLNTENMYILHIASLEGTHMHRRRHKRNIGSRIKASHLEVILKERTGKKEVISKTKTEAKVEDKVKKELKTQITKEIETKMKTQIAKGKKAETETPLEENIHSSNGAGVFSKNEGTGVEEKSETKQVAETLVQKGSASFPKKTNESKTEEKVEVKKVEKPETKTGESKEKKDDAMKSDEKTESKKAESKEKIEDKP